MIAKKQIHNDLLFCFSKSPPLPHIYNLINTTSMEQNLGMLFLKIKNFKFSTKK